MMSKANDVKASGRAAGSSRGRAKWLTSDWPETLIGFPRVARYSGGGVVAPQTTKG